MLLVNIYIADQITSESLYGTPRKNERTAGSMSARFIPLEARDDRHQGPHGGGGRFHFRHLLQESENCLNIGELLATVPLG